MLIPLWDLCIYCTVKQHSFILCNTHRRACTAQRGPSPQTAPLISSIQMNGLSRFYFSLTVCAGTTNRVYLIVRCHTPTQTHKHNSTRRVLMQALFKGHYPPLFYFKRRLQEISPGFVGSRREKRAGKMLCFSTVEKHQGIFFRHEIIAINKL